MTNEILEQQKRVNIDMPTWMISAIDREATAIGVTRQSIMKMWLHSSLVKAKSEREQYSALTNTVNYTFDVDGANLDHFTHHLASHNIQFEASIGFSSQYMVNVGYITEEQQMVMYQYVRENNGVKLTFVKGHFIP